ncbi:Transcription initiation factor TFIID subunit 13 [Ascosphaera acerosa]|nr:Transcription initiation factor TFIID subunit 13 [Ascosphaera acerosa]
MIWDDSAYAKRIKLSGEDLKRLADQLGCGCTPKAVKHQIPKLKKAAQAHLSSETPLSAPATPRKRARSTKVSPVKQKHMYSDEGSGSEGKKVKEPLPETLRCLDEIVTDFIIETCHEAAQAAAYTRRQKIKVDDFRFALRKDPVKLGRVQELFRLERELKEARRAFDQNDDRVPGGAAAVREGEADEAGSMRHSVNICGSTAGGSSSSSSSSSGGVTVVM